MNTNPQTMENGMSQKEIYEEFVDWLGKTWWELPESEQLMPIIKARCTAEKESGRKLWKK